MGGSPVHNAFELKSLIEGKLSPYRDAVLLNSSAALVIAGKATNLKEGVHIAAQAIDRGTAKKTLELLSKLTTEKLQ